MLVEWMIVVTLFTSDGKSNMTHRRGFQTKASCEMALEADLKNTFANLPAVKGHCIDFPARPAGLPDDMPTPKNKPGLVT